MDVSVLIALCDEEHHFHARVLGWWRQVRGESWGTCPITENGLLRVFGSPNYPGGPGSSGAAAAVLRRIQATQGHQFCPDDVSLLDTKIVVKWQGLGPKAVTDVYLLALAVKHRARLATLDSRLQTTFITGGEDAYFLIPESDEQ